MPDENAAARPGPIKAGATHPTPHFQPLSGQRGARTTKHLHVSVTAEQHQWVAEAAAAASTSLGAIVRQALDAARHGG
jgi:hypothetical protein